MFVLYVCNHDNNSDLHESFGVICPNTYEQKYGWKPVLYISKLSIK